MFGREAGSVDCGVDGREVSWTESRRELESGLTVFMEGEGGVGVSAILAAGRVRYEKYEAPPVADACLDTAETGSSDSSMSGPELVHRSISICVVSSGRLFSIARP